MEQTPAALVPGWLLCGRSNAPGVGRRIILRRSLPRAWRRAAPAGILAVLLTTAGTGCVPAASASAAAEPRVSATPASLGTRTGTAERDPLVSISDVDSTILVEARYFGSHNFLGRPVAGYEAPLCLLTPEAARALAAVQAELKPFGMGLKTYDCYRPQQAVNHFVAWARDTTDTVMRAEFYPRVHKRDLFSDGYIAERSGHSRGSTVDLTIVVLPPLPQPVFVPGQPLTDCAEPVGRRFADNSIDMGTGFDCFDPLSHTANTAVGPVAARNRLLLRSLMEKHGFRNYTKEWWHFTLRDEPFPDTYFDLPVR
jgi:zinc D-Ala-D-Ala dipeptidase